MLYMINEAGRTRPVLRCGICDKPILSASLAGVLFPRAIEEGQWVRVLLAHKVGCLDEAQGQLVNDAGLPHFMELTEYLGHYMAGVHAAGHDAVDT